MNDRILALLASYTAVPAGSIREDSRLKEDLGIRSIAFVALVMDFEAAFGVRCPDEVLGSIRTVGDIIKAVEAVK